MKTLKLISLCLIVFGPVQLYAQNTSDCKVTTDADGGTTYLCGQSNESMQESKAPYYSNENDAILDGGMARGRVIELEGEFQRIASQSSGPILIVQGNRGGAGWFVRIGDRFKVQARALRNGQRIIFKCIIDRMGPGAAECDLISLVTP